MSIEQGPSFRANESIPAYVVVAVNVSSTSRDLRVEIADTSLSFGIGIIQDVVSPEGSADVRTSGVARGLLATNTAAGNLLTWQTATGQLMVVAESATVTVQAIARALCDGSTGSIIPVLISQQWITNL